MTPFRNAVNASRLCKGQLFAAAIAITIRSDVLFTVGAKVLKIDAFNLLESFCYKAGFKSRNVAVLVGLRFVDPFRANRPASFWKRP